MTLANNILPVQSVENEISPYDSGLNQLIIPRIDIAPHQIDDSRETEAHGSIRSDVSAYDPRHIYPGDDRREIKDRRESLNSSRSYSPKQILLTRNALKWCAKIWRNSDIGWGPENKLELSAHATEVGYLLALAREKPQVIITGLLYNTLQERTLDSNSAWSSFGELRKALTTTITRKFGPKIMRNITDLEQGLNAIDTSELSPKRKSNLACVSCAIETARASSGLTPLDTGTTPEEKYSIYASLGVPRTLLAQYRVEAGLGVSGYDSRIDSDLWSPHEIVNIRNVLRMSFWHFKDVTRKWGPDEKLPLATHASEVGLLSIMGGCSSPVIIASPLHDLFEPYATEGSEEMLRVRINFEFDQQLPDGGNLADKVLGLIEDATEPPRLLDSTGRKESMQSWHRRKYTVMERIEKGDSDLAALVCAAKTSTLAAGNKMLYAGKSVQDWSTGSADDNIHHYISHADLYIDKDIPASLFEQYNLELSRFILLARNK